MLLKTGDEYTIPDDLYDELIKSYGDEMVRDELEAMRMWLFSNKSKRKTKVGMPKFINSWLARAKKTGGVSPFVANHKPAANQEDSIRGRSIMMGITDISWLEGAEREAQKRHYLASHGYYYDGTGELKYA
jgi:hypothetical protein